MYYKAFLIISELVKAAQQLKEKDSPIKIAKVNGPEEEALLKKMDVKGYPTLFYYREGETEPLPYGGGNQNQRLETLWGYFGDTLEIFRG